MYRRLSKEISGPAGCEGSGKGESVQASAAAAGSASVSAIAVSVTTRLPALSRAGLDRQEANYPARSAGKLQVILQESRSLPKQQCCSSNDGSSQTTE